MLESLDAVLGFSVVMLGVSLLITVLVQTASSVVNLRGIALLQGLQTLFRQSGLTVADAKALAERILHHPLISDSVLSSGIWARASAIRKEEIVRLLKQHEAYGLGQLPDVGALLDTVGVWFDAHMDRVSQFFAHWARLITIAVSVITAFALHLDSAELIQRLYSDADLRAKLVASAGVLESRAEELGLAASTPTPTPGASASSATASPAPAGVAPSPSTAPAGEAPSPATAGSAAAPSEAAPQAAPATEAAKPAAPPNLEKSIAQLRDIQADLGNTGIEILPKFGARMDLEHGVHTAGDYFEPEGIRHLFGVLATAALLSLGAPFWFNLLKQLSNLRTVVANKEQKEREGPAGAAS